MPDFMTRRKIDPVQKKVMLAVILTLCLCIVVIPAAAQVKCPSGCECMTGEMAKKGGASLCGGKQIPCGYDDYKKPIYCYGKPVIVTTMTTVLPSCPSGCSCMSEMDAQGKGYTTYCGGKRILCGYDAQQNFRYCFEQPVKITVTTVTPQFLCPSDSICSAPAQAAMYGLERTPGIALSCGYNKQYGSAMYCFRVQAVATTPMVPVITRIQPTATVPPIIITRIPFTTATTRLPLERSDGSSVCPDGYSCMAPAEAGWEGAPVYEGTCGYSVRYHETMYCYPAALPSTVPLCPEGCECLTSHDAALYSYTEPCPGELKSCSVHMDETPLWCWQVPASCHYSTRPGTCTGTCSAGQECFLMSITRDAATGRMTAVECGCSDTPVNTTEHTVINPAPAGISRTRVVPLGIVSLLWIPFLLLLRMRR